MGATSKALIFPTVEQIVDINRYHITTTGGFHNNLDNLRSRGNLEWVLDAIQYPLFGKELYPTIVEKAAILCWVISADHIFFDGNNRTAGSTLLIFLEVNGYKLEAPYNEFVAIMKQISSNEEGKFTLNEFTEWIRKRLEIKTDEQSPFKSGNSSPIH
jgi:death-on-curing protein